MNKKQIGFLVLSGFLLIATMLVLSHIFREGINVTIFAIAFLISILTAVSLSFTHLFVEDWRMHLLLGVITSAVLLLVFPSSWVQVISVVFIIAGLLSMQHAVKKRKKEFIHFSYYQVTKRGISLFLVALTVLLAVNVYIQTAESLRRNPEGFYAGIAEAVVRSTEPILRTQVEGFSPNMTIDQFIGASNLYETLDRNQIPEDSAEDYQTYEELSKEEARQQLEEVLNVETTGREEVNDVLRAVVIENTKKVFEPIQWLLPILYAFILFFSLRLLVPVLSWLSALIGKGVFALAVNKGFILLKDESVTVQTPQLS